ANAPGRQTPCFNLRGMPPVGFEPTANRLCLPATPFDAPFGFVVWTFSSPSKRSLLSSLYTFRSFDRLGSGSPFASSEKASPNLTDSTKLPWTVWQPNSQGPYNVVT